MAQSGHPSSRRIRQVFNPASRLIAVVTTPQPSLAAKIRDKPIAQEVPAEYIFYQQISNADGIATGYDAAAAASFMAHNRVAYATDESYFNDPPAAVFRVAPLQPVANPDNFPQLRAATLADGHNEDELRDALAALSQAVARYHRSSARTISAASMLCYPLKTCQCLQTGLPCKGTIDANYAFLHPNVFGATADDFTVVVGVNHTRTGKATYTNLTVYDTATGGSVGSMSDYDMAGSVDAYLPLVAPEKRALVARYKARLYTCKIARAAPRG